MLPTQLAEPGQTHNYGDCSTYSGLAGIRSRIRLRLSILDGTLRNLKCGSRNPEGLRRFLEDVLLHEMFHHYHQEIPTQHDDSWSRHGPAFSAKANEIGEKLGLPPVRRTCKKRDRVRNLVPRSGLVTLGPKAITWVHMSFLDRTSRRRCRPMIWGGPWPYPRSTLTPTKTGPCLCSRSTFALRSCAHQSKERSSMTLF
jgi:hypothetical protein